MPLTKAELIAAAESRSYEDVQTPAGSVRIGVMSGLERAEWDDACSRYSEKTDSSAVDTVEMQALLVCLTAIEADTGDRMFVPSDAPSVARWQSPILWPLYQAAWRVNMLGAKAAEDAEKN